MGMRMEMGARLNVCAKHDGKPLVAEDWLELGFAYSCGTAGRAVDLVEAHKCFNLAAMAGSARGHAMRTEIACEMTGGEIALAQRQARAMIAEVRA